MRTGPLAAVGWVVAATLTLGASWSAVQVVRSAVAPEGLAASSTDSLPPPAESTSSSPDGTASPTSPAPRPSATAPAGRPASASGVGGTVVVRCVDGVPRLVSRIPRQGFAVDVDDSPGEVKFSSDGHRTEIKATCAGGQPRFTVEEDDRGGDDNSGPGGGNDDNSGPGGGNSGPGGGD